MSVQGRIFLPDSDQSFFSLKTSADSTFSSPKNSLPSPIYQSLRIFSEPAFYEFELKQPGRHWFDSTLPHFQVPAMT
ncbi:hypothetical protein KSP40_PGU005580 [Platanthera guangdongensis]|uniref:Uncharacterized protein n=1 Tax=Platanthera guangdongensis TaxID=2320717 RepID=A0ABR2LVA8_9ASPA